MASKRADWASPGKSHSLFSDARADPCLSVDSAGSHFIPTAIFSVSGLFSPFSSYFPWGGNIRVRVLVEQVKASRGASEVQR
jgi:hypothetical protein